MAEEQDLVVHAEEAALRKLGRKGMKITLHMTLSPKRCSNSALESTAEDQGSVHISNSMMMMMKIVNTW